MLDGEFLMTNVVNLTISETKVWSLPLMRSTMNY